MAKGRKNEEESKSDGLEIVSIGSLYSGPWDKKYWSSSRGKDRYPYPVGYQALRTHKGLTYKMEIHEGPKGPVFQITSNDKQSALGETPDRAWEIFQKKCCSRIKLWNGKRYSGKIGGVEFFGFKNALVQRLLRELVATISDASEQSTVVANCNEGCTEGNQMACTSTCTFPDLMPYLEKTRVTGKRSRTCRGIDAKADWNYSFDRQPQHQGDADQILYAAPKRGDNDEDILSNLSHGISQDGGALPPSSNLELGKDVSSSANGLLFKSHEDSDYSKAEPCLAQVHRELSSTETCTSTSLVVSDLPQEGKPLDRQCIDIQGFGSPVETEDENKRTPVIDDLPDSRSPVPENSKVNHYRDIIVPDTFDSQQETTSPQESADHKGEHFRTTKDLLSAHMVLSQEPVAESHSQEGSYNMTENSERSDFDSLGDEVARSTISILLPQASPLLTYSSRKKRRKNKPSKDLPPALKVENESKGTADIMPPAGTLTSSGSDGPMKTDVPNVCIDSAISMSENIGYVPDSLDADQCEDHVANQLQPCTDDAEVGAADFQKVTHEPDRKASSVLVNTAEAPCSHKELPENDDWRQKFGAPALHSPVGCCPSSIPLQHIAECNDDILNRDDSSELGNRAKKIKHEDATHCEGKSNVEKQLSMPHNAPTDSSSVVVPLMGKHTAPFSESIICRNIGDNNDSQTQHAAGNLIASVSFQVESHGDIDCTKASFGPEAGLGKQISALLKEKTQDSLAQNGIHSVSQGLALSCNIPKDTKKCIDGNHLGSCQAYTHVVTIGNQNCRSLNFSLDHEKDSPQKNVSYVSQADIHASSLLKPDHIADLEGIMKLIGCYSHPTRISSVLLTRKAHEIYICVSCGLKEEQKRNLVLYKVDTTEPRLGSPYMIGHTSINLPVLKDDFGREVAIDKSGLQFTPNAAGLVVADSIRMPYCREKNLQCSCSICGSSCFEGNAIRIVQIKLGYVSLVLKLNTIHCVLCLFVCEPHHLVALDESGRIYIWVMNPAWSVQTEEYVIPSYDLLPSRIIELKRIPKSASMVVGHNGFGEFSLWDISKRTVLSRFSAPAISVLEILPISLFHCKKKGLSYDEHDMEERRKQLLERTMLWFSGHGEADISCQTEEEDMAIWVFICTSSGSSALSGCYSSSFHLNPDAGWRLGLLKKDKVILGAALHPSTAINTLGGCGIIGTDKGDVYIWELATGTKIGTLHDFAGGGVSHIATDDSAIAIATDGGQLRVYLRI